MIRARGIYDVRLFCLRCGQDVFVALAQHLRGPSVCSVVLKWQGTQQHGEAGAHGGRDEEQATTPERVAGRPEERVLGRPEAARKPAARKLSGEL